MKKAFIWVSGLSFIDKKIQQFRKTNNIPGANCLSTIKLSFQQLFCEITHFNVFVFLSKRIVINVPMRTKINKIAGITQNNSDRSLTLTP